MFELNDKWKGIIASFVRYLLGWLAFWFMRKGIISQEQGDFIILEISALVVTVVTLGWSWIRTIFQVKLVELARHAPAGTSLDKLKEQAKENTFNI